MILLLIIGRLIIIV